ncbi:hypothetical protein AB0I60_22310 [Actinosynnema sp. NPDC050436]|uniref:hypothetical protein n=1 Tax=Actinosynnema sp. NPDC050436 TaxID=3155659 RepID=UPI00340AF7CE
MDDTSPRPARSRGGAPPAIDEDALRGRYGQPGVDLVVLLDRLAAEGGFTRNDAARQWADEDPAGARRHGVLKASGTGPGIIERRRLSEAMKMSKGPVPGGLAEAFLDLWARRHPTEDFAPVAAEVSRLRGEVAQACRTTTRPTTGARTSAKAAEVTRLRDELLLARQELAGARLELVEAQQELVEMRQDLVEARRGEDRFRDLSSALSLALLGLRDAHRRPADEPVPESAPTTGADNPAPGGFGSRAGRLDPEPVQDRTTSDNSVSSDDAGPDAVDDWTLPPWVRPDRPAGGARRRSGWRRAVHALTRGLVDFGESPAEARERELVARITRPSGGCPEIAVLGVDVGVDTSTVAAALGAVLARLRDDPAVGHPGRVTAVDVGGEAGAVADVLGRADSLVLVSTAPVDEAQVSAALDWLQERDYRGLVASSVAVVALPAAEFVRPGAGESAVHLVRRCRAVVHVPFDVHPAETGWDELDPETRPALLELAAAVVDDFPSPGSFADPIGSVTGPIPRAVFDAMAAPAGSETRFGPYRGTPIPWLEKVAIARSLLAARRMTQDEFTVARDLAYDSAGFPHPETEREFRAVIDRAVSTPAVPDPVPAERLPTRDQAVLALDSAWAQGALTEHEYHDKRYRLTEPGRRTPQQIPCADAIYVLDARLAHGLITPHEYGGLVAAVRERPDLYP